MKIYVSPDGAAAIAGLIYSQRQVSIEDAMKASMKIFQLAQIECDKINKLNDKE